MTELSFNERQPGSKQDHGPRKLDYVLAGAGHLLIILAGSIAFSSAAGTMTGGEDAMMVSMVTVRSEVQGPSGETVVPEEVQEEIPEEVQEEVVVPEEVQEEVVIPEEVQEEIPEEVQEEVVVPEEVQEETPEEIPEEVQEESTMPAGGYASVSSQGDAGAGAPGPGTYESRVFNAVRRGYRTSVSPLRSYRMVLTIFPDGSRQVEVVRRSGTAAFDRAVENALATAQIPPMPPGRSEPAVISIEFLGPE